jgi:hypothetical protein
MSFAKSAVLFISFSIVAVAMIGMFAMMQHDKPVDTYYTNSSTIASSVNLASSVQGASTGLLLPMILVLGILTLGAGMMVLKR